MGTLRERERELAAVEVLLDGRGGVLVIEGRAGIGKTSFNLMFDRLLMLEQLGIPALAAAS